MSDSVYAYIWEYRIDPGSRSDFVENYKPEGSWARLFRKGPGYLETRLYQDREDGNRYVTVDRWESIAAFEAFRERFAQEFEALDRACESFTLSETPLGTFSEL